MSKQFTIKDLIPDDANFNTGTEFGNSLIDKSLSKFGAGRSILIDKNNRIIAGNKTVENAAANGFENIVIVETTGEQIVAVKRTDIDLNTKKGREMALADNATAKANISWDAQALTEWDMPIQEWGIDLSEFEAVEEVGEADAEPQIDKAAELNKKWGVVSGDLWQIGEHRLLCGDSTTPQAVESVLDGAKPNLMVTDPPYGVEYDPDWRSEHQGETDADSRWNKSNTHINTGKVLNDDRVDWSAAYQLFPGNVFYCWHAGRHASEVQASIEIAGFQIRSQIVWVKPTFVFGRGHYHWQHEPCWYAFRKGETANWIGDRKQSTVWEFRNNAAIGDVTQNETATGHGTQKPLEAMARPIRNHEGDVYEPFAGSGTTLVACQNLNRKCYAIEISENYCAVILQRMSDAFPDLEIKRLDAVASASG